MNKVYLIRHKVHVEGKSLRHVARELGLSRPTVKKYLDVSEPKRVESGPRPTPVKDHVAPRIDQLLDEWRTRTTPKQRITGTRLYRQLREEGYEVGITVSFRCAGLTSRNPRQACPCSSAACDD